MSATNKEVLITVDDEGPGVPTGDRERIWRPFLHAAGRHVSNGGSGIGLTIVRDVAEAQGGTARVEANDRGGARFVVALPVDMPSAHPA